MKPLSYISHAPLGHPLRVRTTHYCLLNGTTERNDIKNKKREKERKKTDKVYRQLKLAADFTSWNFTLSCPGNTLFGGAENFVRNIVSVCVWQRCICRSHLKMPKRKIDSVLRSFGCFKTEYIQFMLSFVWMDVIFPFSSIFYVYILQLLYFRVWEWK